MAWYCVTASAGDYSVARANDSPANERDIHEFSPSSGLDRVLAAADSAAIVPMMHGESTSGAIASAIAGDIQ
jgi:hypothetical protein